MRDDTGQMLLISAFMIALALIAVTLMLNNVIYSSNVAYAGFMDQSRYDELSLKEATLGEADYAYAHESSGNYGAHMEDYEKALNNIMSLKGRYIDLTTIRDPVPAAPGLTTTRTKTTMTIYGNDAKVSYVLYTGDDGTPPYIPPQPPQVVDRVVLSTSTTVLTSNVDFATLSAVVYDANGVPIPNKAVQFENYARTDTAGNPIATAPNFKNLDKTTNPPPPATDVNGETRLLFMDQSLIPGTAYIRATVDGKTSAPVEIQCSPPAACEHNIGINAPSVDETGGSGKFVIKLPLDLQYFTGYNVPNSKLKCTYYSPNIQIKASPVYYSNYGSINNVIVTEVELNDKKDASSFAITLSFEVTGTCSLDGKPYDRMVTVTVYRDESMGSPVFTNP